MVKSRFDLYNPLDDMILEDPAYAADAMDFQAEQPVAPLNVNVNEPYRAGQTYQEIISSPEVQQQIEPSYNIYDLRRDAKTVRDVLYGQPGGYPDPADLFQGLGRLLLPGQEALTPEDEKNLIGVQLENAMAKKAEERIRPEVEALGKPARFTEPEIARRVYEDIGGREFSRPKAFLQEIQTPVAESVRDLAEGRPIYDFSPIELTDLVFSVIDQIDVAVGLKGILGGTAKVIRAGLSAGTRALFEALEKAPTKAAQQEIISQNPKNALQLKQELDELKIKIQKRDTTEDLTEDFLEEQTGFSLADPELRDVRFATGKPKYPKKPPETVGDNIIKPGTKGGQTAEYNKFRDSETQRLIQILKKRSKNAKDKNLTMQELIDKYKIQGQVSMGGKARKQPKLKDKPREMLKKEIPDLYEQMQKFAKTKGALKRRDPNDQKIFDALESLGEKTFRTPHHLSTELARLTGIDRSNIQMRYVNRANEFKKPFDKKIVKQGPKTPDIFNKEYSKIGAEKFENTFNLKQINPQRQVAIKTLVDQLGLEPSNHTIDKLFQQFLEDRYRSIKESGLAGKFSEADYLKYVTGDLPERKLQSLKGLGSETKQDLIDEFDNYIDVEFERLYLQSKAKPFLENLYNDVKYRPYVQNILEQPDYLMSTANKTHDIPLFVTRVTGKNRLKKKGRMLNTGTEPEFLTPHFQPYNRLQVIMDPLIQKIADVENSIGLQRQMANMPVTLANDFNKQGGLKRNINSRTVFIGEGYLKVLSDRGYVIQPERYNNQLEFVNAVGDSIDQMYKDRDIRSIVPIIDSKGRKTVEEFGLSQEQKMTLPLDVKAERHNQRLKDLFDYAIENNIPPEQLRSKGAEGGFIKLNKGGPVKMAMGGDPLINLNQQQFAPDPAFEGQDFFKETVDSGNLYAFNPLKLFKLFGKVDGVQTPKKITEPEVVDAPPGTTLPATQVVQPQDFPFRSYTLEAIMDPNAPKAATPQAWADFLVKGKKSPISELQDSGLEQYLRDFESYFPNQKITQTQLIDYYETSPIGNLSFKVKQSGTDVPADSAYLNYSGRPKHQQAGNQPLDEIGEQYREIVVEAGPLPGETRPFVQSGHYSEPNVIGFTRVANYTGKDGRPIAVIQELQTDMLTTVRKEQERLQALLGRIKNYKASAEQKLQSASEYDVQTGQMMLQTLNQTYPPTVMKTLEENQNLIKPFPNEAAKELIPGFSADIQNLQKQIDAAVKADIAQTNPETGFLLTQINNQQMEVLNKLQDLNRSGEIDQILGGVKVPQTAETEDLARIASDPNPASLVDGFSYGQKSLTLFPPVPFNKQPDYVDLLLKATIKDAQSKGINKVAIFPADLVNRRWGKTPGSDAAKKFEDLYGKVAIQQMKNIAKKYGGTAQFEVIMDPTKASKGLRYYNRSIDGNKFDILKEEVPRAELSEREVQPFFDEQIKRTVEGESDFRVALTREVAPGQTMDYYVLPADNDKGYILQPFKQGDELEDAQIVIEEFNPQETKMFTITLDSPQAEQPMYLFKKKSGGSIDKDSLVSITDIYGEYGR